MKKPRKHPAKKERISQRIYEAEQKAMREALKDLVVARGVHRDRRVDNMADAIERGEHHKNDEEQP